MFLKQIAILFLGLTASATSFAQLGVAPEHQWAEEVTGSHVLQMGVDAWDIHASVDQDSKANMRSLSRLQLANSYPVWTYRDVSPWMRFEGGLRVGADTLLTLKYRADQSTGSRLDEAGVDWAFHAFGVKVGVLDPKMSWCRTYDVDSPWVRESNGFCTTQPDNFTKSSAPAVQTYANLIVGDYSLQGILGVYRPGLFHYAPRETATVEIPTYGSVVSHHRKGMALSATNLKNGTELRLGLMTDSFAASVPAANGDAAWLGTVDSKVLFAGLSWYVNRQWAMRGTYFRYLGNELTTTLTNTPFLSEKGISKYNAMTFEANYQANAVDVLSAAYTVYVYDYSGRTYSQVGNTVTLDGYPHFRTQNLSMSWRRDWGRGVFSVLQYTRAQVDQRQSDVLTTVHMASNGNAVGLRLGYRF
jgi:hypothetical protein